MKFLVSLIMTAFLFGCASTGTEKGLVDLNDDTYGEGVQGMTGVVLFTADWCPACQAFKPVWDEVTKEYEDKLSFRLINTDESAQVASAMVQFIPTLTIYINGIPVASKDGLSADDFRALCDLILEKKAHLDVNGY